MLKPPYLQEQAKAYSKPRKEVSKMAGACFRNCMVSGAALRASFSFFM